MNVNLTLFPSVTLNKVICNKVNRFMGKMPLFLSYENQPKKRILSFDIHTDNCKVRVLDVPVCPHVVGVVAP